LALDSHLFLSYTISTMKVGDLVTMDTPLTPRRGTYRAGGDEVGIIQKIVQSRRFAGTRAWTSMVYHIRWPDGGISNQYDNEIVLVSEA